MLKIRKIEPQKRKGRFKIFFDDGSSSQVSEDVILKFGLKEGSEIKEEKLKEFEVYLLALRFLSFRPRSEKEMRVRLLKKFPKDLVEKIIKELKEEKFLDDREFAKAFLRNREILRPSGRKLLFLELRKKGIEKEIIEEVLNKVYNKEKELELAKKAAKKKIKIYKNLPRKESFQKLLGFLQRRGFNWQTIKEVLNEIY